MLQWRHTGDSLSLSFLSQELILSCPSQLCVADGFGLSLMGHSHPTSCLISGSSTGMDVLWSLQARNPGCLKPSSQWHCLSPRQFSSLDTGVETNLRPAVIIPLENQTNLFFLQGHLGYRGDWTLHHCVFMRYCGSPVPHGNGFLPFPSSFLNHTEAKMQSNI